MRLFLMIYVVLINIIGFMLIGIDKWKAQHAKWRIPERILFLAAILLGSIGTLTGMYVFHHKTRKLRFSIGIPVIMVVQLVCVSMLFLLYTQQRESPSQAVQIELDRIQNLDEETIGSFISYENLMNANLSSGGISSEAADAVKKFFRNFTYSIRSETISGQEAAVSVQISNIDAHALARDLRMEMVKNSAALSPEGRMNTASDYYLLLRDTLDAHSYDPVVSIARFHLQKEQDGWTILADETLEDELVSGFITYINDPCLLSAEEVLVIYLEALKDFDADQWKSCLNIDDVFSAFNPAYAAQIDEEYVQQLAGSFDYEILSCEENGSSAEAAIRIKSTDMNHILSNYLASLREYADSTKSIRDNPDDFSEEVSRLLLAALQENTASVWTDISLSFSNNGCTWEVYFDSDFTNALMGDMNAAVENFSASLTAAQEEMQKTSGELQEEVPASRNAPI